MGWIFGEHLILDLSHAREVTHLMPFECEFNRPKGDATDNGQKEISPVLFFKSKSERREPERHTPPFYSDEVRVYSSWIIIDSDS